MAINLSTIPYQFEYDGKIYLVYDRATDATYTYFSGKAKGGEALIVRSKTDESETRYHRTTSANYAADWLARDSINYEML